MSGEQLPRFPVRDMTTGEWSRGCVSWHPVLRLYSNENVCPIGTVPQQVPLLLPLWPGKDPELQHKTLNYFLLQGHLVVSKSLFKVACTMNDRGLEHV